MARKLTALFVASTLALGSISTSGWSASGPVGQVETSGVQTPRSETKNVPPLAPAGAAGIQQAQGAGNEGWIIGGFVALFLLVTLIGWDKEDESPVGVGTE